MTNETKKVRIALPTEFHFLDNDTRAFWSLISDAVNRNEPLTFTLRSLTTELDMTTLARTGVDPVGNPTFGVGQATMIRAKPVFDVEVAYQLPAAPAEPPTE